MNQQPCEQYTEWMSLAQDGLLNSTQSRLLHAHVALCPECQAQWKAITLVSRMLHSVPVMGPLPGFVARFENRLARREERRRQAMIWILLGIGVVALTILALPSLVSLLRLTGYLVLPYRFVAYARGLLNWTTIVLNSFAEAVGVLVRYFVAQPAGTAGVIGSAALATALCLLWTRLLIGRMSAQRTK